MMGLHFQHIWLPPEETTCRKILFDSRQKELKGLSFDPDQDNAVNILLTSPGHQQRSIFMGRKPDDITECVINPEKFYKTPESVLSDNRLTQAQKDKILQCWEQEEIALMRAEGENMTPKTDAPAPVEMLEKIKKAEKTLESDTGKGKTA
jgi:hypothetical protein